VKNWKIKVCGMRDPKNILDVASLNPDYMGFIFYEGSKRYVGPDFSIPSGFPKKIKRVGVFVNATIENVLDKVSQHELDFVQLHGDESVDMCRKLKNKVGVIKVFSVDESFDFNSPDQFKSCSDFFLFDTKGENYGGTGRTFNWNLLRKYDQQVPFFLSGGLSPENIHQLTQLENLKIHALDFNSQIESEPGIKDLDKLDSVLSILTPNY
jgi:phosphoribosylanthranilate isomerase